MPNVAAAVAIVHPTLIALPAIAPLTQHKLWLNAVVHMVAGPLLAALAHEWPLGAGDCVVGVARWQAVRCVWDVLWRPLAVRAALLAARPGVVLPRGGRCLTVRMRQLGGANIINDK